MIHYQLQCSDGHGFEGWFRDSSAFDEQARRKLLTCPACGTAEVRRGLMAPSVRSSRKQAERAAATASVPAPESGAGDAGANPQQAGQQVAVPDQLRAALQRLRAEVERNCDDVGDGFADAARRLHRAEPVEGEKPRGIYGRVTELEREALADEGIETTRIPWLPRADG